MSAGLLYALEMKLSLALALLAGTIAWAADPIPMDVKTGEWEYTVTSQMSGMPQAAAGKQMPQIPPEQLAKLPPEQRARIEAMMKQASGMASGQPTTTTTKRCVTKDDLAKLNPNVNKDQSCKMTVTSSSRNKQEVHMECELNGNKQTGTAVFEALSSESMKFNVQVAATNNGQPMNMTINGTSKWLGATCTE